MVSCYWRSLFLLFFVLTAWRLHERKEQQQKAIVLQSLRSDFLAKLNNASSLIRPIIHDRATVGGLPTNYAIAYPILLCDVRDNTPGRSSGYKPGPDSGWGGGDLRILDDVFLTSAPTNTVVLTYCAPLTMDGFADPFVGVQRTRASTGKVTESYCNFTDDDLRAQLLGLRWLIMRTYGVLSHAQYNSGHLGDPVSWGRQNLFTDIWVIDLQNMIVVAHDRFRDSPLPSVIPGNSPYFQEQNEKVWDEILSWVQKNAR